MGPLDICLFSSKCMSLVFIVIWCMVFGRLQRFSLCVSCVLCVCVSVYCDVLLVYCKDRVGQVGWRLPGACFFLLQRFLEICCIFGVCVPVFILVCCKIGWDREGGGCQVAPDQEV